MKLVSILITLLIGSIVFGQSVVPGKADEIKVSVKGNIFNYKGTAVTIAQYLGKKGYKDYHTTKVAENGNFNFGEISLPSSDYYVLKTENGKHLNLIIKKDDKLEVNADANNILFFSNFVGSDDTQLMTEFIRESQTFNAARSKAQQELRANPTKSKEINANFKQTYLKFTSYRTKFHSQNRSSAALLALLGTYEIPKEFKSYEIVANDLLKSFPESRVVQSIRGQLKQNKAKYEAAQILAPGKTAPEITMKNVAGKEISLSDLKGKVVLIDFWASWCGPCRRENPNVVKTYNKYKNKGFEIFSVSLDKDQKRWEAAITKDGLIWDAHVSDLKGWGNAAAKTYGVSSVPFTVLIDKEGKVIDTNLRGIQLEQALATIFGE